MGKITKGHSNDIDHLLFSRVFVGGTIEVKCRAYEKDMKGEPNLLMNNVDLLCDV